MAGAGDAIGPLSLRPPRFVGRAGEAAALAHALAAPPALVLVEGEAGIGKTRLLAEFFAGPGGAAHRVATAVCPPLRQPLTLAPLVDAVRQATGDVAALRLSPLAGALRPLFPEWAAELPPEPEPAGDAGVVRHRVFRAIEELLGGLGVTVLVVEDLHWADESTVEFLLFLVARGSARPSLVVTYRPEEVAGGALLRRLARQGPAGVPARIGLGPLGVGETASLVSSMLSGEYVSERFAVFLHGHTEGVPLAIEESMHTLREHADLIRQDGAWLRRPIVEIRVPATIRDAVLERAGGLPAQARALVRAAAVLADPVAEATLFAVAGLGGAAARAALAGAVGSGLLADDGRGLVSFRHSLAGQAVYEAIPAPDRRSLHRRAGLVLERLAPPPVPRLARHFREAGDTGRWSRYAEQAAGLAHATGDEASAATLLHDLVVNAGLPAADLLRLTNQIVLLSFRGDTQLRELSGVLRALLASAGLTAAQQAAARFQLGRVLLVLEEFEPGRAELEQAVAHLDPGSTAAVRAMMLLGWPQGSAAPAAEHLQWLHRAARAAVWLGAAEQLRLAVDRATALLLLGDEAGWAEAAAIPTHPAQPATGPASGGQQLQLTRFAANLGEVALMWGRYGAAGESLTGALERADRYGYTRLRAAAATSQAQLDWATGAWDGLAGRVAALLDDDEVTGTVRAQAALVAGRLHAARGEHEPALTRLREAVAEAGRRKAVEYTMDPAAALAASLLAGDAPAEALRVTEEPMRVVTAKGTWLWATELVPARVLALLSGGRSAEATELVAAYARGLGDQDAPAPQAALLRCRAILAAAIDPAGAAPLYARAAQAWQALPRPYDMWLAREQQAHCLRAAGATDQATALLRDVYSGLTKLGADGDAARVASRLREHGVDARRDWRRGRHGYGDRLSPRELEVVELVATGRTNREIAAALGRATKTVAGQLNSAMRKLGVTSRTAVAVRALETGVLAGTGPASEAGAEPVAPDEDGGR